MKVSIPRFLSPLLFALCLVTLDRPAQANGTEWTVMESSGTVTVTAGETRQTLIEARKDARLPAPFSVKTGRDGRLVIIRDEDSMTVGPDSLFEVPAPVTHAQGFRTRITQTLGSLLYHVQRRPAHTFEVETPYLVSVVKGTTFNILVTDDATTVSLIEGRLFLQTPDGKDELFLDAGQAAVKSRQGDKITVKDQHAMSPPTRGPITIVHNNARANTVETVVSAERIGASDITPSKTTAIDGSATSTIGREAIAPIEADLSMEISRASLTDASLDLSDSTIALDSSDTINLGDVSINSDANVELGDSAITLGSDLAVDSNLSLGSDVSLGDTSLDVGLDVGLNVGGTTLTSDIDLGSSIELGDTSITLDSGLDGPTTLELDSSTVDITVSTDILQDISTTVTDTVSDTASSLTPIVGNLLSAPSL